MHAAIIDIARNCADLTGANSTEVDPETPHPIIGLITEWKTAEGHIETRSDDSDLGGTMRMGEQACLLKEGSVSREVYGQSSVKERHRHRYEVNPNYIEALEASGMLVAGRSMDESLVEMIEFKDHPWFVACQFHPEFTSTPRGGHPLFKAFIVAALNHYQSAKALEQA